MIDLLGRATQQEPHRRAHRMQGRCPRPLRSHLGCACQRSGGPAVDRRLQEGTPQAPSSSDMPHRQNLFGLGGCDSVGHFWIAQGLRRNPRFTGPPNPRKAPSRSRRNSKRASASMVGSAGAELPHTFLGGLLDQLVMGVAPRYLKIKNPCNHNFRKDEECQRSPTHRVAPLEGASLPFPARPQGDAAGGTRHRNAPSECVAEKRSA